MDGRMQAYMVHICTHSITTNYSIPNVAPDWPNSVTSFFSDSAAFTAVLLCLWLCCADQVRPQATETPGVCCAIVVARLTQARNKEYHR